MMSVPFLDLGAAYREIQPLVDGAVQRVLSSGWYILGPEVEAFEEKWASYCSAKHAVGVANGLDAIVLTLRAMGVGPGDEVIVPSNTYIATWLAVSTVGATPVPVEPTPLTYNIDPALISDAVTTRTRAVIAVHLYGQPADLTNIKEVTDRHSLMLIEDAAQCQGARYMGTRIGAFGDAVCWSFYPAKNLGALGDGGAVTTNDEALADRIRILANYGSRVKYHHEVKGLNSRLDPLQAAVLSTKLDVLDQWNERRAVIAKYYRDKLDGLNVVLPHVPVWSEPVWHLFVLRTNKREALAQALRDNGIATQIHYPVAPHRQPAYRDFGHPLKSLPLAETLAEEVLSLPIGPHQSMDQTDYVVKVLQDVIPALGV